MDRGLGVDVHTEDSGGGLRELVLRWFTETQETLILNNGNFPQWFQGFAPRKDAEDLLRDKAIGCFLIRLSDKVLGYILSYKGQDRCRHFVISQNAAGLFVIEGACHSHQSLTELIEYYKVSPIQPYGEYLTCCCYENNTSELYDVVRFEARENSGVSVRVLKSLWDQKSNETMSQNNVGKNPQKPLQAPPPPSLPYTTKTRKLTGTVSANPASLSREVPPVPKRGMPLSHSLSESLADKTSPYNQTEHTSMDLNRGTRATTQPQAAEGCDGMGSQRGGTASPFDSPDRGHNGDITYTTNAVYSRLTQMENRNTSLPKPGKETDEEISDQVSTTCVTLLTPNSPTPLKRFTCQSYSLHEPRGVPRQHAKTDHLDLLQSNPLYQSCKGLDETPAWPEDFLYAEVPQGHDLSDHCFTDNPYELIPEASPVSQVNTYETLGDVKSKQSKSTLGRKNIKWPKFLHEYKKK